MKNILKILISILLLLGIGWAEEKDQTIELKNGKKVVLKSDYTWEYYKPPVKKIVVVFKDLKFGSTLSQFNQLYAAKKDDIKSWPDDGVYYFNDSFCNEPATLFFYFMQDSFFHGEVIFKIKPAKDEIVLNKYNSVKKVMISLYGQPTNDGKLYSEWLIDNNYSIKLLVTKEKNSLYLGALYNDNSLAGQLKKNKTEPAMGTISGQKVTLNKEIVPKEKIKVADPVGLEEDKKESMGTDKTQNKPENPTPVVVPKNKMNIDELKQFIEKLD
ncbi:MAG: DUF3157 family protein [Candidatus Margulisbacteria bacterium]|nr:DUF3157 family protein [Candidatus Margulisiibacteriota bacterium]